MLKRYFRFLFLCFATLSLLLLFLNKHLIKFLLKTMRNVAGNIFKKRIKTHRPIKYRRPHLKFCPQKKAQCLKLATFSPKKPNSARRKVSKIIVTSTKKKTYCYIPGIGHKLKAYSTVLIRGGRRLDVPGMKYTAIRGKYDFEPLYARRNGRSKFGVKKFL